MASRGSKLHRFYLYQSCLLCTFVNQILITVIRLFFIIHYNSALVLNDNKKFTSGNKSPLSFSASDIIFPANRNSYFDLNSTNELVSVERLRDFQPKSTEDKVNKQILLIFSEFVVLYLLKFNLTILTLKSTRSI